MVARRDIELNPTFLVPPGVVDVRHENLEDNIEVYNNPNDLVSPTSDPVLDTPNSTIPRAPSSYSIISQTVRIGADGSTSVDVLLEFPDTPGVYDIDVAVTPA